MGKFTMIKDTIIRHKFALLTLIVLFGSLLTVTILQRSYAAGTNVLTVSFFNQSFGHGNYYETDIEITKNNVPLEGILVRVDCGSDVCSDTDDENGFDYGSFDLFTDSDGIARLYSAVGAYNVTDKTFEIEYMHETYGPYHLDGAGTMTIDLDGGSGGDDPSPSETYTATFYYLSGDSYVTISTTETDYVQDTDIGTKVSCTPSGSKFVCTFQGNAPIIDGGAFGTVGTVNYYEVWSCSDVLTHRGYECEVTTYSRSLSGNGGISTATASCTTTSGSCSVTIPTAVKNSTGSYNSVYSGLASNYGTMSTSVSKTATTATISGNSKFYSIYSSPVTNYYYSS